MQLSDEQQQPVQWVLRKRDSEYQIANLNGFAGTGKSATVDEITSQIHNCLIISYSGIAANNVGGSTAHSAFGIPTDWPIDPNRKCVTTLRKKSNTMRHWEGRVNKANNWTPKKYEVIRHANLLIIDEAYALRCDTIDFIEKTCRKARKSQEPFGGLRVLLVGDEGQGQPIIKDNEIEKFKEWGYKEPYDFRTARCFAGLGIKTYNLTRIFRQDDSKDGLILSRIRTGTQTAADIEYINSRCVRDTAPLGATTIAPHLDTVAFANELALSRLSGEEVTYSAHKTGKWKKRREKDLPYPTELTLKPGARVIIKKNDKRMIGKEEQEVFNGDQGTYHGLDKYKRMIIALDRGEEVYIKKDKQYIGQVVKKKEVILNPDEPEEQQVREERESLVPDTSNVFEQYPVRLGFAITIKASQGSTLNRVHADLRKGTFAAGDLYVLLSRVKGGFRNLTLSRPLRPSDNIVSRFLKEGGGEQFDLEFGEPF